MGSLSGHLPPSCFIRVAAPCPHPVHLPLAWCLRPASPVLLYPSRGLSWAGSRVPVFSAAPHPHSSSPLLAATLQAIGSHQTLCPGSTCLLDLSLQHHSLVPTLCQVLGTQKAHIPVPCSQSNGAERICLLLPNDTFYNRPFSLLSPGFISSSHIPGKFRPVRYLIY